MTWSWSAPGAPWPLGATEQASAPLLLCVQVAVWAPDATGVECCVFDPSGRHERQRIALRDCTDGVWHAVFVAPTPVAVAEEAHGFVYGWRVRGPWAPAQGHRFNPAKVLLDPWAREVVGRYAADASHDLGVYLGHRADAPDQPCPRDNAAVALKARLRWGRAVSTASATHGPAVQPLGYRVPWDRTVLYEAHVKGLTQRHPDIPVHLQGRYAALAHPALVAHLQRLGVTTLSLLPVHARADEARLQGLGLSNYWGYASIGFLAPEPRYAVGVGAGGGEGKGAGCDASSPVDVRAEFRTAVAGLHAAGIEVLIDVVFNHTAETDELGPTLSLRGLANARYYRLRGDAPAHYENWTGCGNCLDLTEPRVVELVLASLREWVTDFGVDGFRFDLAPILGRDARGQFDSHNAFFAAIQADPMLSRVKLVAEPWDIGPGGYQLGAFPPGWREWNDRYRDDLRDWWLGRHAGGQPLTRGALAQRWAASSAQFQHSGRAPTASVNFLTAHDGFTLRDLLSFEHKRNHANGEDNRDGHGHNRGWDGGVEGASVDVAVHARRLGLSRALLASLLLSQGTPMLLAGDELGHTQQGNNNAYCQDNATTWLDWQGADAADLSATVARLTALRRRHPALRQARWLNGQGDVRWLRPQGQPLAGEADWHATEATLQIELCAADDPTPGATSALTGLPTNRLTRCWILCNGEAQPRTFALPESATQALCVFDSAQVAGSPACQPGPDRYFELGAHSLHVWTDVDVIFQGDA